MSRRTRPQPALTQQELDRLTDEQVSALAKSSQSLANESMAAAAFYQRTADRCRKALKLRKRA